MKTDKKQRQQRNELFRRFTNAERYCPQFRTCAKRMESSKGVIEQQPEWRFPDDYCCSDSRTIPGFIRWVKFFIDEIQRPGHDANRDVVLQLIQESVLTPRLVQAMYLLFSFDREHAIVTSVIHNRDGKLGWDATVELSKATSAFDEYRKKAKETEGRLTTVIGGIEPAFKIADKLASMIDAAFQPLIEFEKSKAESLKLPKVNKLLIALVHQEAKSFLKVGLADGKPRGKQLDAVLRLAVLASQKFDAGNAKRGKTAFRTKVDGKSGRSFSLSRAFTIGSVKRLARAKPGEVEKHWKVLKPINFSDGSRDIIGLSHAFVTRQFRIVGHDPGPEKKEEDPFSSMYVGTSIIVITTQDGIVVAADDLLSKKNGEFLIPHEDHAKKVFPFGRIVIATGMLVRCSGIVNYEAQSWLAQYHEICSSGRPPSVVAEALGDRLKKTFAAAKTGLPESANWQGKWDDDRVLTYIVAGYPSNFKHPHVYEFGLVVSPKRNGFRYFPPRRLPQSTESMVTWFGSDKFIEPASRGREPEVSFLLESNAQESPRVSAALPDICPSLLEHVTFAVSMIKMEAAMSLNKIGRNVNVAVIDRLNRRTHNVWF